MEYGKTGVHVVGVITRCAIATLMVFLVATSAWAGQATGSIEGHATDQGGGRLPGVLVEVASKSAPKRPVRTATTDAEGLYKLSPLEPGEYVLRFALEGFTRPEIDATVIAGQISTVPVTLNQALSESVQVLAEAVKLQTSTATRTASITNEVLNELPTASRNYTHVLVTGVGVSASLPDRTGKDMTISYPPGTQSDDGSQSVNPSVNGARPQNNAMRLNGVDATNMMSIGGGLGSNINLPLDALEEVEVQTALPSAAKSRNSGANIELVTRTGTDRFAGTGAYYFQDEKFNANEFFANRNGTAKPDFKRDDASGTFGGPILRKRTTFFASGQKTRFLSGFASGALGRQSLPTALTDVRTRESIAQVANEWMRTGAEDNPRFAAEFLRVLRLFPADQVNGMINQFFTNPDTLTFRQLTPNDIHPVAINILNAQRDGKLLIPTPSASKQVLPGNGVTGREILWEEIHPTEMTGYSGMLSLQHRQGTSNNTRFSYIRSAQQIEETFGWADSISPTLAKSPSTMISGSNTHSFGSRLLHELNVGLFNLENTRISKNRDIFNSTLGIYALMEYELGGLAALMPTIDIVTQQGSGGIGNAWDFLDEQLTFNVADKWTLLLGKHSLQAGIEYRHMNFDGEYMARTNGDIDFNNWVLFFTGHSSYTTGSDYDQGDTRRAFRAQDLGFFVQDDWKLGAGVSLNVGVRYDINGNLTEAQGRLGNYYLPDAAAELGVPVGYQVPGNAAFFKPGFKPIDIGLSVDPSVAIDLSQIHKAKYESTIKPDLNNIAPRIGLAWQPTFARKMVIRGGYGTFYERTSVSFKGVMQTSPPFFIGQAFPAAKDLSNPYPTINVNPFQIPMAVKIAKDANGTPRWVKADGSEFPGAPYSPKTVTVIDPLLDTPYQHQWTANVQYELRPGLLADVGYVGSKGVGLLGTANRAYPIDPRKTPVNGFTDIYNKTGAQISTTFFVPEEFLGLAAFNQITNIGRSNYHALQANLRGRVGKSLFLNGAYTYSRARDTASSNNGILGNPDDPDYSYGPADYDRPHRLTTSFIYNTPGIGAQGLLNTLTKEWNISGILTAQSGAPFSVSGNAYIFNEGISFASFKPGMTVEDAAKSGPVRDRLNEYFNWNVFENSPTQLGNSGRNILRGPRQIQFDLMLGRTIPTIARQRLELRWEAFNVFNTPVFGNPGANISTGGTATGQITSTIGGPRTMQLAVRYMF